MDQDPPLPCPETYDDLVSTLRCAVEEYSSSKEAEQEEWLPVAKLKDQSWECKVQEEDIRGLNRFAVDGDIIYIWTTSDEHRREARILDSLVEQVIELARDYKKEHKGTELPHLRCNNEYGDGFTDNTHRVYDAAIHLPEEDTILMLYQFAWAHEKTWKHMDCYQCELLSHFSDDPKHRGTYFLCVKAFHEDKIDQTAMSFLLVLYDLTQPFKLPLHQHPFFHDHMLMTDEREHVHLRNSIGKHLGRLKKKEFKKHWKEEFPRASIIQVNHFKTSSTLASNSEAAVRAEEILQFTKEYQQMFPAPAVVDLGTVDVNAEPMDQTGEDFTIPAELFFDAVKLLDYVRHLPDDELEDFRHVKKMNSDLFFTLKTGEFVKWALKRRSATQSGTTNTTTTTTTSTTATTTISKKRKSESPFSSKKFKKMKIKE